MVSVFLKTAAIGVRARSLGFHQVVQFWYTFCLLSTVAIGAFVRSLDSLVQIETP